MYNQLFTGKINKKDVYVKPPLEAETVMLWKLKTTVYGLCDTPSVKGILLRLVQSKVSLTTLISTDRRMEN